MFLNLYPYVGRNLKPLQITGCLHGLGEEQVPEGRLEGRRTRFGPPSESHTKPAEEMPSSLCKHTLGVGIKNGLN